MAFNTAALKGLFSKLKPAAKTVANYGDDAAKALTTYGDDAARMAFANADDLAAATAQTDDIAKRIRDVDAPVLWDSNNVPDGLDFDIVETSDDYGLSEFNFLINGARNPVAGSSDELVDALTNPQIMDDIDTSLQFGKPISNFDNTDAYIDQMVSPTPNWASRWGELERYDPRLQSLYDQLRKEFDTWTDFSHNYGFTPPHVNYDSLADQIIKLEGLKRSGRW